MQGSAQTPTLSYIGCDLKTGCPYINRERDKQTRLTYSTHSLLPADVRKTNDAGGQEIAVLGREVSTTLRCFSGQSPGVWVIPFPRS